jgi:hypothetical protein
MNNNEFRVIELIGLGYDNNDVIVDCFYKLRGFYILQKTTKKEKVSKRNEFN